MNGTVALSKLSKMDWDGAGRVVVCNQRDETVPRPAKGGQVAILGIKAYAGGLVVLASLSDEALSVFPTRPQPAAGRTENNFPPDLMFLFPRPLSHFARAEPDVLKEQS